MRVKTIEGRKVNQSQQCPKNQQKVIQQSLKLHHHDSQKHTEKLENKDSISVAKMRKNNGIREKKIFNDQTFQSQDAFIECIDDYIGQLDQGNASNNQKSKHSSIFDDRKLDQIQRKVKKQKQINKNLQKSVIELQKILWKRTDKLEKLQKALNSHKYNKQNFQQWNNISKSKLKTNKCLPSHIDDSSVFPPPSTSILTDSSYEELPRRKTELPSQIQKIISQTLGLGGQKRNSKQHLKNFF